MKRLLKQRIVAGIVALMIAVTASMGIAYADIDISGTLQAWFDKKTDSAIASLEQSVQAETALQKAALKQQLQSRLAASSEELDAFTEATRAQYILAIQQHAEDLLAAAVIDNEQDRRQLEEKLQLIADSAIEAMNTLMASYTPPAVTFIPAEPVQPAPMTVEPIVTSFPSAAPEAIEATESAEPSETTEPLETSEPEQQDDQDELEDSQAVTPQT